MELRDKKRDQPKRISSLSAEQKINMRATVGESRLQGGGSNSLALRNFHKSLGKDEKKEEGTRKARRQLKIRTVRTPWALEQGSFLKKGDRLLKKTIGQPEEKGGRNTPIRY